MKMDPDLTPGAAYDKAQSIKRERHGIYFALATVALWSGFVLVTRIGGMSTLTPFDIAAVRFGTAALVLAPVWLFLHRVSLFNTQMLWLSLTGGVGYALFVYAGFHLAPAAHGALLVSGLLPFFVAGTVWISLGEKPRGGLQAGLACIALGIACLAFDTFFSAGNSGGMNGSILLGDAMLVSASVCWSVYTVLLRRWNVSPWDATIGGVLLSAIIFLPLYAWFFPTALLHADHHDILLQAIYQGVLVVIVAMVLYTQALARLGPARLGALMAVVPAVSGIGASLWLDERLSMVVLAGLVLTSAGAWLGARR